MKALAVEDALRRTDADRLVVADADVWCPGLAEAADRTDRPVVIPHSNVHRLTESDTRRVLAGGNRPYQTCERVRRGVAGGGIVIINRATYEQVPLDPRFQGWGQEDTSWGLALTTMTGKITRYSHPLIHLWHPPQERQSRAVGSTAGRQLEVRYHNATTSREAMAVLIDEAKRMLRSEPCLNP